MVELMVERMAVPMAVRVGVRVALLLLWECLELEGGAAREVGEHRVGAGGERTEAVVSYALPLVGEEEADSIEQFVQVWEC